ncbi:MAG: hypothetical protein CMJ33_03535 [Phycisphaerae bacterium]|nr:hypothetical protein [Phycisphaerae bacterium]
MPYHHGDMQIDLNDLSRRRLGRVNLDPEARPPRVTVAPGDKEISLDWEGALDDAGNLRKCLACGSGHLFRIKTLPSVTPIFVILAFAGTAVSLFGYANNPIILAALILVMVAELIILVFSRTRIVCYRCRSRYVNTQIARYHLPYNQQIAEMTVNQTDELSKNTEQLPGADEAIQNPRLESRRERLSRMRIEHAEEDRLEQARNRDSNGRSSRDSTPGGSDDDS